MADFRRWIIALAVVALFVGLAGAQTTGGPSSMSCAITSTVTPTVRSEGFTEGVGDIALNCTGGSALTPGAAIPQANITVYLNTAVTSRILGNGGSGNASEALLIIDESGAAPQIGGYGPTVVQTPCPTTNGIGCNESVGTSVISGVSTPGVPVIPGSSSPGWNVFQGVITGTNAVTFYGVPIMPPVTAGLSRTFRITNIRANANGISGGGPTPGSITASVSISPSNAFTINQPLNTVAFVAQGLNTSLRNTSDSGGLNVPTLAQCTTNNGNGSNNGNGFAVTVLRFGENFPTAFKTRVALVNGNTSPTASFTGQNIPGQVYNSESMFTQPLITGNGSVAGLADWGTRLKAVFTNIPSGVSIFVSTTNVATATSPAPTTAGNPVAGLVISETVPDANGQLAFQSVTSTQGTQPYAQVPIVNGTGVAVWEVTQNNYTTNQNFDFGVFVNYSQNVANNAPTPGNLSVSQSLAPNPTNGAFSASSAADPTKVSIIPRFADTSTARTFSTIAICQTVLLYPYVTTITGFETGIAIANTSQDPFGTTPQTGSCALNWYTAGASGTNPAVTTTPAIPGGTVYGTLASAPTNAGPNFTGYMFAVCNFQFAHGYAAITDVGARSSFASYLALVSGRNGTLGENNNN